jgi:hypothetical protein
MPIRLLILGVALIAAGYFLWQEFQFEASTVPMSGTVVQLDRRDRDTYALVRIAPDGSAGPFLLWITSWSHLGDLVSAHALGTAVKLECVLDKSVYRCRLAADDDTYRFRATRPVIVIVIALVAFWLTRKNRRIT